MLCLYINSEHVGQQYPHPGALWFLAPLLLYWVSRLWLKTTRGEMHDDPLVFAVKDRASLYLGAACAVIVIIAA